jgi:hypothetical protein
MLGLVGQTQQILVAQVVVTGLEMVQVLVVAKEPVQAMEKAMEKAMVKATGKVVVLEI